MYLSQLLNKPVYQNGKPFGKIIDLAIFENRPNPPVSKVEIKHGKEKLTVNPQALTVMDKHISLPTQHIPLLPYDHKDFYLVEDLLDKQVIDTDGRRLVRVNDVVLDNNGEFKVVGIDIGFAGVLRRLGLGALAHQTTIIPWTVIEAFDYQTGDVRIKLKQTSLNTLHPADIADILEEAGSKERVGIVEALDAKQAARAIEEADEETQISILENLGAETIKNIVSKMHVAEIADVINDLNPLKAKEVQNALGAERAQKVRKLVTFSDDVAGGIMHLGFFQAEGSKTVKETIKEMESEANVPESIIVVGKDSKIIGTINSKELLIADKLSLLQDNLTDKKYVYPDSPFEDIIELFAQYNLRVIPVVDQDKKPTGIILIDDILKIVEEENEYEDL